MNFDRAHCNLMGHGPLLDQDIEVCRQCRAYRPADQKIRNSGMSRVRLAYEIVPGNQASMNRPLNSLVE